MPKVGSTFAAMHLDANHAVRAVFFLFNCLIGRRLVKAWPAGARIKFGLRGKQWFLTNCTGVCTLLMMIPKLS